MTNRIKTTLLLTLLTVALILTGNFIAGPKGMYIFFIIALALNLGSYWFSDKIILKMYRATPLPPHDPVVESVRRLAQRAKLPMPKVYEIPSDSPNAFATGRNPENSAIAVTGGIRQILSQEELEGVLAHELAHIKNRDTLISCIAAALAGAIMMLASFARWGAIFGFGGNRENGVGPLQLLVASLVAPIAAMIIQMGISRSREYLADATGAKIAGTPFGLSNALRKLEAVSKRRPMPSSPSTAHLFIINPLSGRRMMKLFSTHPPMEERIQRLNSMRI